MRRMASGGTLCAPREFGGMRRLCVSARACRTVALEQKQQFHLQRADHPSGDVERTVSPGTHANFGVLSAARYALRKSVEAAFVEGIPLRRARFDAATFD